MTSLFKNIALRGLISGVGGYVTKPVLDHTSFLRGRAYSFIENTASAVLPQRVQNSISTVLITALSALAYLSDNMQAPMNIIQEKQNQIVYNLEDIDKQKQYGAAFNFINTTLIAPLIEECLYRGPQIVGGIVLEQATGLETLSSQTIVGSFTNTLFGLAHTGQAAMIDRVTSEQFIYSFSKGIILTISAALVLQGDPEGIRLTEAATGLAVAIVGHAISNLPNAIWTLQREWNE